MRDRRDLYADLMQRLETAVLHSPGALDPSIRQALARGTGTGTGSGIPAALAPYAEKVAQHAYTITDEEVQALLAAGYSQDQLFEATVSVALGAALARVAAGLSALRGAALHEAESGER